MSIVTSYILYRYGYLVGYHTLTHYTCDETHMGYPYPCTPLISGEVSANDQPHFSWAHKKKVRLVSILGCCVI